MKYLVCLVLLAAGAIGATAGPLRATPNSRYFTDDTGKAVYLAGWHTWNNFQDLDAFPPMDFEEYVESLASDGSNLIRLWVLTDFRLQHFDCPPGGWGNVSPLPFQRTGPGVAADGLPKFNLTLFNEEFFQRLSNRVALASSKGIYVMVMFYEAITPITGTNFRLSPYYAENNVNGLLWDASELFTLRNPAMMPIYENYIRKVIDTLNGFDNVLFEPANEPQAYSSSFISYVIDFVHAYEATKPKQHPVIYSSFYSDQNHLIFAADNADWIAPGATRSNWDPALYSNPKKPWLMDSDHIFFPSTDDPTYALKCLFRGYYYIHMDAGPVECPLMGWATPNPKVRKAAGDIARLANRMDLNNITPSTNVSSTAYALFNPGREYLVWQPATGSFTVDMKSGTYDYEWFVPDTSTVAGRGVLTLGDGQATFLPPSNHHGGTVLYLKRVPAASDADCPARVLTVRSSDPGQAVVVSVIPPDDRGTTAGRSQFSRIYKDGTAVILTAPATAHGNTFHRWLKDGVEYDRNRTTAVRLHGNYTLTAVYVGGLAARNVPEAAQYRLLHSLTLPDRANFNRLGVPYQVDTRASVEPFTRIGYYLELQSPDRQPEFVWVSMDAFTTNVNQLGVPSAQTGVLFQQPIFNMNVRSSVPGIPNADALAGGYLEFWPGNYHNENEAGVMNASNDTYDFGDRPLRDVGYGSMQIHFATGGQTLLAFNGWGGVENFGIDLGIGNAPGAHPDWTFTQNAAAYAAKTLEVYVYSGSPPPMEPVTSTVREAYVFYNNSAWDDWNPGADVSDSDAIAPDKAPLWPGQTASSLHYTSYSRGLNGIVIDFTLLVGTPTARDFRFKVGNDNRPEDWVIAPQPSIVSLSRGAGLDGSDRVTLIWPDGAIQRQWLEVTVLSTAQTGLAEPKTFYFGNAIGETLSNAEDARVDVADELRTRANHHTAMNPAGLESPFDFNRDTLVDVADQLIARANRTTVLNELRLIDLSGNASPLVEEAGQYTLVYSLDLPDASSFNTEPVPYSEDNHASIGPFRRIAYYLELKPRNGESQYLWVSMDAFTQDAGQIGVPAAGTGAFFQGTVANLNVRSSVPGVIEGDGLAGGYLEFWAGNYHNENALKVPNASSDTYDWGDSVHRGDVGYGSMQVHNTAAGQTLFGFNGWGGGHGPVDLGIGSHPGAHPDWTFAQNGTDYEFKRLRVYVLEREF